MNDDDALKLSTVPTARPILHAPGEPLPQYLHEVFEDGIEPGSRKFWCDWRHNGPAMKWLCDRYADIDIRPDVPGRDPAFANIKVRKERKVKP